MHTTDDHNDTIRLPNLFFSSFHIWSSPPPLRSYGLESRFRTNLYREFEEITLLDYHRGSLYGLEKFWAFHHFKGLPKEANIDVNTEVRTHRCCDMLDDPLLCGVTPSPPPPHS